MHKTPPPHPHTALDRLKPGPAGRLRSTPIVLLGTALIAFAGARGETGAPSGPVAPPVAAFRMGSRILFQGDSITDGNRGRSPDPNHILGHGYVFIIAARYGAAFPGLNLNFVNRGVGGDTVSNLSARWQQDCIDLKPDLLSIMVGVNDCENSVPVARFEQVYDQILSDARAANPNVRLVLCAPFTLPVGKKKANYAAWLEGIKERQEAVARLALKYNAALVRLQPVFEAACTRAPAEYWIWDGIHPTYSGHELVADEWIRTVRKFWP